MRGFGDLEEFGEQLFGPVEAYREAAGFEPDAVRQVMHAATERIGSNRQSHLGARTEAARFADHDRQPLAPVSLDLKVRITVDPFGGRDQSPGAA
jgi:hypothetical protein